MSNEMTVKGPPASINLNTKDLTEVRLILHVLLDELKAGPTKSRERSLAVTKLEEARMWLNEALMTEPVSPS